MKKVSILMAIVVISIYGVLINSANPIVASPQATIDDDNNVQTFEGDLLPQQSPSNEKVIQFDETSSETITPSGDLQNPSIQGQLNQSQLQSQKDVQLQQSEGKKKYDWELPNGKGCSWNDPLPGWPRHRICTDLETQLAWDKYNQTSDYDKPSHLIQDFSRAP